MKEPLDVICQILTDELGLADGQVMKPNQRHMIPTDGLFIAVDYAQPSTAIGSVNRSVPSDAGMTEIQTVTMRHLIQIDIMAYNDQNGDNEARARKEEVVMALGSIRSQELQIANTMQIAPNPGPILNVSAVEGPSMLTRFTIEVPVTAISRKEKSAPYFDTFKTPEVHVNV